LLEATQVSLTDTTAADNQEGMHGWRKAGATRSENRRRCTLFLDGGNEYFAAGPG
jgi:hypothetical protein